MSIYHLPAEHTVELEINGQRRIKLVCTREALRELAVGWLYNERLIAAPGDILSLRINDDETMLAVTMPEARLAQAEIVRGSGLGGLSLDTKPELEARPVRRKYSLDYIRTCAEIMGRRSVKYAETGGMHCSALFDERGMLLMYEDIGRHNTLDKLAGHCLLRGVDASDCLLVTTGRISGDMVKKAGRMGVSVVASLTTPTDAACALAVDCGMSIVGYLRRERAEIYTNAERIV